MQIQTNDNTTISIPLSFTVSKTSDLHLQDSIKGDTVTPQEWIARELARIRHDIKPRHCPNYEGLLEVLDDMSRFLQQQVPHYQQQQTQQQIQQSPPGPVEEAAMTAEHDRMVAKQLLILQQQQQQRQQQQRWQQQSPTSPTVGSGNNCNTCYNIGGAKFNELVNALVYVIQYHDQHFNSSNNNNINTQNNDSNPAITSNKNDPNPVQLVRVFEDIRIIREQDGGKIKDPILAQQQLFFSLFGHVQLTSHLYRPWEIICEWAKQLVYTRDWHEWMGFGLEAFIKAKSRRATMNNLPYSSSPSNSSTTSNSSSSSSGSSSCGSNHQSGQLMMEQLQALLQNVHLVDKTFRA
ncbi:hypothetical protein BDA99DRAFT_542303 [Phascolomyces articulosus]|uniref:Uncharacterized protein n=1 Tax=Phascolomyces articulosus TaxID=60185 RepID=A0AAD5K0A9_9FUNG|nr:hypothetical protein BDA99DRAFT_542303 [Phascolomyces articulosus]